MILSYTYYQRITGDLTTPEGAFATAASSAQELLEDDLSRPGMLELGERTEQCEVYPNGLLFPSAVPVVSVDGDPQVIDNVVYGATADGNVFTGFFPGPPPNFSSITYVGGFDIDSAPEHMLRDLAFVTYAILRPSGALALAAIPADAVSLSVGDVSVSYGPGGAGAGAAVVGVSWSHATWRHRRREP